MLVLELLDDQVPVLGVVVDPVITRLLHVEDHPLVLRRERGNGELLLRVHHPPLGLRRLEVRAGLRGVGQRDPPLVVVGVRRVGVLDEEEAFLEGEWWEKGGVTFWNSLLRDYGDILPPWASTF